MSSETDAALVERATGSLAVAATTKAFATEAKSSESRAIRTSIAAMFSAMAAASMSSLAIREL
jgi:hypothetical protein